MHVVNSVVDHHDECLKYPTDSPPPAHTHTHTHTHTLAATDPASLFPLRNIPVPGTLTVRKPEKYCCLSMF